MISKVNTACFKGASLVSLTLLFVFALTVGIGAWVYRDIFGPHLTVSAWFDNKNANGKHTFIDNRNSEYPAAIRGNFTFRILNSGKTAVGIAVIAPCGWGASVAQMAKEGITPTVENVLKFQDKGGRRLGLSGGHSLDFILRPDGAEPDAMPAQERNKLLDEDGREVKLPVLLNPMSEITLHLADTLPIPKKTWDLLVKQGVSFDAPVNLQEIEREHGMSYYGYGFVDENGIVSEEYGYFELNILTVMGDEFLLAIDPLGKKSQAVFP